MTRIIDSHCHIYPEHIAPKAVEAVDRFYGGLPATPLDGTAGTLLSSGRSAGISRFVVHSVATAPSQVENICRFIAEAVEMSRGAFIGLGALHPDAGDVRGDAARIAALGLRGVKIHPDFQGFEVDSPKAFRLFEACIEFDLPVLVHTGDFRYDYSNPERTARVLKALPELRMIGAHLGGWSVWDRAEKLLSGFENLTVDTSSSFRWLGKDRSAELIRSFGTDRVMFGTDYPMWPQRWELDFLRSLGFDREEEEKILWKNCAGMYRISFDSEEDKADACGQ
ncbi:MAG: amidohydrolase [Clostridia bacterium]|nr:amidohydrolase [Clostridia bacterium]